MTVRIDEQWVSPERFAAYVHAAGGDLDLASRLYEWNAKASSAIFEVVHHFEVLLRNAIVRELASAGATPNMPPGTPWVQASLKIDEVLARLRKKGKDPTAARVYAGLMFGAWQQMFSSEYEELWRHSLQWVFRHNRRVDRAQISGYLESINQLRNLIAHHGSVVDLDADVEVRKILRLASWIDPDAGKWLESIERVSAISKVRPVVPPNNVMVVAGAAAFGLYTHASAYAYPEVRAAKFTEYVAFYVDQEIKPTIPYVTNQFAAVDWSRKNMRRLLGSTDPDEKALGRAIGAGLSGGFTEKSYHVYLLSPPKDSSTVKLPGAIEHERRGRGSAFVRSWRYLPLSALQSARSTAEL